MIARSVTLKTCRILILGPSQQDGPKTYHKINRMTTHLELCNLNANLDLWAFELKTSYSSYSCPGERSHHFWFFYAFCFRACIEQWPGDGSTNLCNAAQAEKSSCASSCRPSLEKTSISKNFYWTLKNTGAVISSLSKFYQKNCIYSATLQHFSL